MRAGFLAAATTAIAPLPDAPEQLASNTRRAVEARIIGLIEGVHNMKAPYARLSLRTAAGRVTVSRRAGEAGFRIYLRGRRSTFRAVLMDILEAGDR